MTSCPAEYDIFDESSFCFWYDRDKLRQERSLNGAIAAGVIRKAWDREHRAASVCAARTSFLQSLTKLWTAIGGLLLIETFTKRRACTGIVVWERSASVGAWLKGVSPGFFV